ncbi:MAG TPA: phospho-sugar mutase, partial [Clostridia bacterium]|nr:phospho-sugar mutase [Clostridia bacterium]
QKVGADAIIATDPDADRMGLALKDKNGEFRILSGNQIGCLLLYHILSRKREDNNLKKNSVAIKTIVSTEAARAIADDFGIETVDVLTGFKYIGEKIREYEESEEKDFLFGFEESYGFLAGTYARDKDAVAAAMLITEIAAYYAYKDKTLFDALQEIQSRYGYFLEDTSSVSFEGKQGMEQMKRIMNKVRNSPIDAIGGLKVLLRRDFLTLTATGEKGERLIEGYPKSDCIHFMLEDRCWACIRPSGTEPKIKVYSASFGQTEETAAKRLTQIKEYMHGLLNQ